MCLTNYSVVVVTPGQKFHLFDNMCLIHIVETLRHATSENMKTKISNESAKENSLKNCPDLFKKYIEIPSNGTSVFGS